MLDTIQIWKHFQEWNGQILSIVISIINLLSFSAQEHVSSWEWFPIYQARTRIKRLQIVITSPKSFDQPKQPSFLPSFCLEQCIRKLRLQ